MSTRLLLLRHAQTDWNLQGRWQGQFDLPLNRAGIIQAQAIAQRLTRYPIAAIYSSDLRRATQTAHYVSRAVGVAVQLHPVWRERHAGILQGMTASEIHALYPTAHQTDFFHHPPGGETNQCLQKRTVPAYQKLVEQHPNQTILIVSHGGTLSALIRHLLGIPIHLPSPLSLNGNTGLSIINHNHEGRPILTLLNDTSHLE